MKSGVCFKTLGPGVRRWLEPGAAGSSGGKSRGSRVKGASLDNSLSFGLCLKRSIMITTTKMAVGRELGLQSSKAVRQS